VRIGIGRPARGDVASFVLGRFSPEEEIELDRILDRAAQTLDRVFSEA
jgi:PTH1 family peptidyl-tRNA hydrolase